MSHVLVCGVAVDGFVFCAAHGDAMGLCSSKQPVPAVNETADVPASALSSAKAERPPLPLPSGESAGDNAAAAAGDNAAAAAQAEANKRKQSYLMNRSLAQSMFEDDDEEAAAAAGKVGEDGDAEAAPGARNADEDGDGSGGGGGGGGGDDGRDDGDDGQPAASQQDVVLRDESAEDVPVPSEAPPPAVASAEGEFRPKFSSEADVDILEASAAAGSDAASAVPQPDGNATGLRVETRDNPRDEVVGEQVVRVKVPDLARHHLLLDDQAWLLWALFRYYSAKGNRTRVGAITRTQFLKLCREAKIVAIGSAAAEGRGGLGLDGAGDHGAVLLQSNVVDILFQRHQSHKEARVADSPTAVKATKHSFNASAQGSRDGKHHSLQFPDFARLAEDLAAKVYPNPRADRNDSGGKDDGGGGSELTPFQKLLEYKFCPLALSQGSTASSSGPNNSARRIRVIKSRSAMGPTKSRRSAAELDLAKIGQIVDVQQMVQETVAEDAQQAKLSSSGRRKSMVEIAALSLEVAMSDARRPVAVAVNTPRGGNELDGLLRRYRKPLRRVFDFYCTLTKAAPKNESVPSEVARTHVRATSESFRFTPFTVSCS